LQAQRAAVPILERRCLGATILHLVGIDPKAELFDPHQHPKRPVNDGTVIRELL
jgi:hypothetical protein